MIGKKMEQAINDQIREELESAYIYLAMATYFESQGLDGMAQWMKSQTIEEIQHGMRLFDHINGRGGRVALPGLKQPQAEWSSPLEAWQDAYAHEQLITSRINNLTTIAREEKDYQAEPMLAWFTTEQIEEEATSSKVAEDVEMVGDAKAGLLLLDRELGARAFPVGSPLDPAAYSQAD